ncbi:coiled-coil domain-containing protein 74A isoform X2 [Aplysia californica]|uniref:Coiled-coil domain-containing protein 74A isoform X2 n=1 Tax=Aplysia californica TaxID=6500 RepID=A0ABM0JKZ2_APLCA|nr:coiled-coil domain-containing protein 74A isoform X2 [Aplysia californica]
MELDTPCLGLLGFGQQARARYPKPFVKDNKLNMDLGESLKDGANDDERLSVIEMNPAQRIQYLERSLLFLRQQHSDVLHSLHEEVESLKKENKELQFKIVMSQKAAKAMREEKLKEKRERGEAESTDQGDNSSVSSFSKLLDAPERSREEDKNEEMKIVFLEEEVKELKHALRETRNKNQYLTQLLEQAEEQRKRQQGAFDALKYEMDQGDEGLTETAEQIASGSPPVQSNGQPLSLQQCHAIIKHLQQVNDQQSHELDRLKLDLRDVLYSHKWTPDAYLMAKAYVAEDDRKEDEKGGSLPRIPLKNPSRKLPEIAYIRENVSLPALRQTVGNKAVERRKRTQVLQRAKLRPGGMPP